MAHRTGKCFILRPYFFTRFHVLLLVISTSISFVHSPLYSCTSPLSSRLILGDQWPRVEAAMAIATGRIKIAMTMVRYDGDDADGDDDVAEAGDNHDGDAAGHNGSGDDDR